MAILPILHWINPRPSLPCALREYDHLADKMYFDHLSPIKFKKLLKKAEKWSKLA